MGARAELSGSKATHPRLIIQALRTELEMTEHAPLNIEIPFAAGPNPRTVLLADDNDYVRQMICVILEFAHYQVLEAGSGAQALRISDEHQGPIDLLLTDIQMPEMRGDELADEMLKRRPGIPVLCMSGDLGVLLDRCTAANALPFIAKPFRAEELLARVASLIQVSRPHVAA